MRLPNLIRTLAGVLYLLLTIAAALVALAVLVSFVSGVNVQALLMNPHVGVTQAFYDVSRHWYIKTLLWLGAAVIACDLYFRATKRYSRGER